MVPLDLRQFGAFEEQRLRAHVTAPILLRLPLHRRSIRVLDLSQSGERRDLYRNPSPPAESLSSFSLSRLLSCQKLPTDDER
jgi:hypothetical protein